jgi:DNA invertase Pin-like site-specific DNA recombinase
MSQDQTDEVGFRPHPKISHDHLERLAYVYVRQSTMKQVIRNQGSQDYQYQLRQRAQSLGWPDERIQVIDQDQGLTGAEATARTGYQTLIAEVSLGQVGIIFGYEVSRLARNNRDWYHLLDLSAMFGTLIADNDGVYEPRAYNDRLLLGLKGTMSEAELHLLRQRLDQGRMSKVKRGTYLQQLPTGLVRLPDRTVAKDPDDQVRHVLGLMFTKFNELGSVNRVVRYLRKEKIRLPRRQKSGPYTGQIRWKVASEAAVIDMVKNPAFAGAFAYGRRQTDRKLKKPGQPASGLRRKPMEAWLHLQQDVYPAYLSWDQFLANQERLRQNGMRYAENRQKAQGTVRKGPGILQGLVVCGRCSHHLRVVYKHTPRYYCNGLSRTADVPVTCTSLRAPLVDRMVEQAFFEALHPAHLDALDVLLEKQHTERRQLERQWQEQLKRSEYDSHLAQRQYNAVDPENRLVAAELERRWETKLRELRQTKGDQERFRQRTPPETIPPKLRALFQDVGRKLPELWPDLENVQKKELLRSLIKQVIVKRPRPDQVTARIVWLSGCYTDHEALTSIHSEKDVTGYADMLKRLHEMWQQRRSDQYIAAQLTAEGFHTARSPKVSPISVRKMRLKHNWYSPYAQLLGSDQVDGKLTVNGMAKALEVDESVVYRYIYAKEIPPERISHETLTGIYLITPDDEFITRLKDRLAKRRKRKHPKKSS